MPRTLLTFVLVCLSHAAFGDVFVVTNTNDAGAGSLRDALLSAAKTGPDDIIFRLSGPTTGGEYVIQPLSSLPDIPTGTRILGETQRSFGGDSNPLGPEIAIDGVKVSFTSGLRTTNASDCLIREISVRRFTNSGIVLGGSNNKIEGCYVGTDGSGLTAAGNKPAGIAVQGSGGGHTIGGTDPAARNIISGNADGIDIERFASGATIQGNFIGTNAAGTAALGNFSGMAFGGDNRNVVVGGSTASARNIISGNQSSGIYLHDNPDAPGTLVAGNFIGTDVTGMKAIGNAAGVFVDFSNYNTIGEVSPGARNVISGNRGPGVVLSTGSRNNVIQNNFVGVAADGVTPLGNVASSFNWPGYGIYLTGGSNQFGEGENNTIGGPAAEQGNVIAHNSDAGIAIAGGAGNLIQSNSIFDNGTIGIDLGINGPTRNDPGDADTDHGFPIANEFQNFPVLESVAFADGVATISGTLASAPNKAYRLDFFASAKANVHGFVQGETFLGFSNVVTDGAGNASFQVSFSAPDESVFISATATDPNGNTSEFGGVVDHLANISTRLRVHTGDNVLVGGFIVTGTQSKRVVIRALGPSLTQTGIQGALQDPTLQLFSGNTLLAENDNWKESEAEIQATGIPPKEDAEAAIVHTLGPGAYTAIVRGKDSTAGVGLVEAYDLDASPDSKLANISTRGFVDDGENAMIAGFIIPAQNGGGATLVVRALGPSLQDAGVNDPLVDPILALYDANGTGIAFNSDWKSTQQEELEKLGLAPTRDTESAIYITLPPGSYTAIVTPDLNLPGVGLVEVYNLQ